MRFLILLAGLLAIAPLVADETITARSRLEQFSEGLDTFHAEFRQLITAPDGRLESEGEGEVWLARPARFRWVYGGDFPELIVADGENVWLYDEALEQVTVKPQSDLVDNSPLLLLTDLSPLDQRFRVTEVGDYEGMKLLELVSIDPESEFERVLLGLADSGLKLMAMEDAFGLRTEILFSGLVRNPSLEDSLFRFTPPAGTDVVGDVRGAGKP